MVNDYELVYTVFRTIKSLLKIRKKFQMIKIILHRAKGQQMIKFRKRFRLSRTRILVK